MIGQLIGKYRVTRRIGQGGMGEVYEALHEGIGQRVAIKLLHPAYAARPEMVQRFFNEARAVHLVDHPGLVKTLDFGQLESGAAYMVMEFLDGEPLSGRLHRQRVLPLGEALRIARQVASALAATHGRGIVHRDLKPDNIILVPDPEAGGGERAKLLDFGIAKLRVEGGGGPAGPQVATMSGAMMGTPLYMSPEQCRGAGGVDDRTDVYALGVMLFQMLAGEPPFSGQAPGDLVVKHIMQAPPPLRQAAPGAPEGLEALVGRMLAKASHERPAMAEVAAELERLGADRAHTGPVALPPGKDGERAPVPSTLGSAVGIVQPRERARTPRLAVAAFLTVAIGGAAWVTWHRAPTPGRNEVSAVTGNAATSAQPRMAICELTSVPAGAAVLRTDGTPLGETPWREEREPGSGPLKVLVRLAGHKEQVVTLDPAGSCRQELLLAALPAAPAPADTTSVDSTQHHKHRHTESQETPARHKRGSADEEYIPKPVD